MSSRLCQHQPISYIYAPYYNNLSVYEVPILTVETFSIKHSIMSIVSYQDPNSPIFLPHVATTAQAFSIVMPLFQVVTAHNFLGACWMLIGPFNDPW